MSPRHSYQARHRVAICYDFDLTLSPDNMQSQGYIQDLIAGNPEQLSDVSDFWRQCNELGRRQNMDANLAYMYCMLHFRRATSPLSRQELRSYGRAIRFYPGLEDWFERLNAYGAELGLEVEHYVISSGLKEMIEASRLGQAGVFREIYASAFCYNAREEAIWPAQAVNYTNKTQFLFRISKGIFDVNDNRVNSSLGPEELHVPFRNMIYIGDSDTDIPCMTLVRRYGGQAIAVYDSQAQEDGAETSAKVRKLLAEERISHCAPSDYRPDQKLYALLQSILRHLAAREDLIELEARELGRLDGTKISPL